MVVDAEDSLALHAAEQVGHLVILLEFEWHAVAFGLPVGRVQVVKGVRTVVFGDAVLPAEMLDVDPRESQVGLTEILLNAGQVETRRATRGNPEASGFDLAAEAHLLQVVEAGRALDIEFWGHHT